MGQPNTIPYQKDTTEYPLHPEVTVQLADTDGNAFAIVGTVRRAMEKASVDQESIDAFIEEAMSGNYDHLLQTCIRTVNVT